MSRLTQDNASVATQEAEELVLARLQIDGPCDRARNHAVLCGAMIARADHNGCFDGELGIVTQADVHACVTNKDSKFSVTFQVQYNNGQRSFLNAPELFQELLLYREHVLSAGGDSLQQNLKVADRHIQNLTILSNVVRDPRLPRSKGNQFLSGFLQCNGP